MHGSLMHANSSTFGVALLQVVVHALEVVIGLRVLIVLLVVAVVGVLKVLQQQRLGAVSIHALPIAPALKLWA
jgi:hypothetical protein